MADVPGFSEDGVEALRLALVAAFPGQPVYRRTDDTNVDGRLAPSEYPKDDEDVAITIIDGDLNILEGYEVHASTLKTQRDDLTLRFWIRDDNEATRSTTFRTRRREILNAIEDLDLDQRRNTQAVTFQWRAVTRLRGATDVPPYAGADVSVRMEFTE